MRLLDPVTLECLKAALEGDGAAEMALLDRLEEAGYERAKEAWAYITAPEAREWWTAPSVHTAIRRGKTFWGFYHRRCRRDFDDIPHTSTAKRAEQWINFWSEAEAWSWLFSEWGVWTYDINKWWREMEAA